MLRLFNSINVAFKAKYSFRKDFKKCYLSRGEELIIKEISGNLEMICPK